MISRRGFSGQLAGMALGLVATGEALAQIKAVEGQHYVKLSNQVSVAAPAGKIEVIEFFSYLCPHCFDLESSLEGWIKALPADVAFRRVPAGFNASYQAMQKVFYALEAMGQLDKLHGPIFKAIHLNGQRLDNETQLEAFLAKNGVDTKVYKDQAKSFSVVSNVTKAKQLTEAYKIDGVPAIGVHGRFYTAGSLAGDNRRALAVADYLIGQVRTKR